MINFQLWMVFLFEQTFLYKVVAKNEFKTLDDLIIKRMSQS